MAQAIALGFGAVVGAAVGSYLATILVRWPQGISAMRGRSRCDACGRKLGAGSLIPVVSFLRQRGRCSSCGAAIAMDHLVMELAAALVGGVAAASIGASPRLAAATAVFGWTLLLLAAFDLRHFWLPDRLTMPLALLGILANACAIGPGLAPALIGALAGFASLELVGRIYRAVRGREGLGGGDAKMFGAIGAWLGWEALPMVMLAAACLGLAWAAVDYLRGRSPDAAVRLPLGSLMALAAWPVWLAFTFRS